MSGPEAGRPTGPGGSPGGRGPGVRHWHAELAWTGAGDVQSGVLIEAADRVVEKVRQLRALAPING